MDERMEELMRLVAEQQQQIAALSARVSGRVRHRGRTGRIGIGGIAGALLAFDVGPGVFQPLDYFLWGLTPIMSELIGREVLPSYGYFRVYRKGDRCRVHSDRPSSEHGVSMTLEYSDGQIWDLQVGKERTETLYPLADDFGSDPYESIGMEIGDAVLYQATNYPHGRIDPNPNAWSAHLFLFYVDRDGPYRNCAFDEKADFEKVSFEFV